MDKSNKGINILVTPFNKNEILKKVGYSTDKEGFLIDEKTKEKVKAEDDLEINVKKDNMFALISGSHVFVRNIAGYSHYLTKKGLLKLKEK